MNANLAHDNTPASFALEHLIAHSAVSVSRLSILRSIFDDTSVRFAKALRESTDAAFDFYVKEISAVRIGETHELEKFLAIARIYDIAELHAKGVVAANFDFAASLIDVLFGSNVVSPFVRKDRILTKVEARAAEFAMSTLIESFQSSFRKIVDTTFKLERTEPSADWMALGRKGSVIVICAFRFLAFGIEGEAIIALPRSALDPFRDALSRDPNAEGDREDTEWADKLRDQVVRAVVALSATMEKKGLTLDDVSRFRVGQIISLPFSPTSLIPLKCADRFLFNCQLGQKEGFYTVRIEELIDNKQEFFNRIVPH